LIQRTPIKDVRQELWQGAGRYLSNR